MLLNAKVCYFRKTFGSAISFKWIGIVITFGECLFLD